MNDRPDWLPEPVEVPRRPLSERLHLAAASIASLLLGVLGSVMIAYALIYAVAVATGNNRSFSGRIVTSVALPGAVMITLAYLLRWCLRRARHDPSKLLPR